MLLGRSCLRVLVVAEVPAEGEGLLELRLEAALGLGLASVELHRLVEVFLARLGDAGLEKVLLQLGFVDDFDLPWRDNHLFLPHVLVGARLSMFAERVYYPVSKAVDLAVSFRKLLLEDLILAHCARKFGLWLDIEPELLQLIPQLVISVDVLEHDLLHLQPLLNLLFSNMVVMLGFSLT